MRTAGGITAALGGHAFRRARDGHHQLEVANPRLPATTASYAPVVVLAVSLHAPFSPIGSTQRNGSWAFLLLTRREDMAAQGRGHATNRVAQHTEDMAAQSRGHATNHQPRPCHQPTTYRASKV